MSLTPEQTRIYSENADFQDRFRASIVRAVSSLPALSALDIVSGNQTFSLFWDLHPKEHIDITGIATVPTGRYDLVVCNFSLHNAEQPPAEVISSFERLRPKFVGVAEYDFPGVPQEEFIQTFAAQAEIKELEERWGGDVAACFEIHSRNGRPAYEEALDKAGYQIVASGEGTGAAEHKFFLVGKKAK